MTDLNRDANFSEPGRTNPTALPRKSAWAHGGRCLLIAIVWLIGPSIPVMAQPATAPATRNVLLIVSDDLKASVLGCYGDTICQTPQIDRLAKSGMVFRSAYCQATWCAPSRQSFMHSRYQGKVPRNLGRHLIENGFYSARVGKIYHMRVPGDIIAGTDGNDVLSTWLERFNSPGLEAHTPGDYACLNLNIFTDALTGRQSTQMPHRPFVTVRYPGDGSDQPDFKSADTAIRLLRERAADQQAAVTANRPVQPFFLAVGLVRPHYPMVAPERYFEAYPWESIPLPEKRADDLEDIPRPGQAQSRSSRVGIDQFPDNQQRMWAGYYAAVSFMDNQVGRILDELDRLDLRDSTTVVFTSDHGYHLGEHDFWQKSNLHEEVIRVPLIIDVPGLPAGETDALAELVDLYPTFSEWVGLPIPESVQGKSLLPVLRDPETEIREAAVAIHRGGIAIRTADVAYLQYRNGQQELYDMRNDPGQFTNLADRTGYQEVLRQHQTIAARKIQTLGLDLGQ